MRTHWRKFSLRSKSSGRSFLSFLKQTAMFRALFRKKKTGSVPVYLNVYDLSQVNGYAYWLGLGVYHSGVQVHGVEYAFGAHDYPTTGIFEGEPRQCPGLRFRKSILVGRTDLGSKEVRSFMEKLAEDYTGNTYNLITKNCNHFCNDACLNLTGKRIPSWVNRLARIGFLCKCVLPVGLGETPVRVAHPRTKDGVHEEQKKKLRSHSSRFVSSSDLSSASFSSSGSEIRRRKRRRRRPPATSSILSSPSALNC